MRSPVVAHSGEVEVVAGVLNRGVVIFFFSVLSHILTFDVGGAEEWLWGEIRQRCCNHNLLNVCVVSSTSTSLIETLE